MPAPGLTDEQCWAALKLKAEHGSFTRAGAAGNINPVTLRHRVMEAQRRGLVLDTPPPPPPPPVVETQEDVEAIPKGLPYERAWQVWLDYVGALEDRYRGPCARPLRDDGRIKVVAAGDFHCPHQDMDALARLIAREQDADVLVIGGDMNDAEAASTFTPRGPVATYDEERAAVTLVLERLSEAFPKVLYLKRSNHSDRYEKRIREKLPQEVVNAILDMTGGILSPDLAIVRRFPNVEIAKWTHEGRDVDWLCVVGDVAFSHAQKSSRVPGSSLRGVHEWLTDFEQILGLPKLRGCVQFHTHTQSLIPFKADAVLVEAGAMCLIPPYMTSDRVAGRPQRTGYVTLELVDGRLDMDSVKLRWIDEERRDEARRAVA